MPIEIERKFLVVDESWRGAWPVETLRQGYLVATQAISVRVRLVGDGAFLTIKGQGSQLVRPEFEYPIPRADADALLDQLCTTIILEKQRYSVTFDGLVWTVDEFQGRYAGLILAEIELDHPDQPITLPPWVGEEVTYDPRYQNAVLARDAGINQG